MASWWKQLISVSVAGVGIILIKLYLRSRRYPRWILMTGKTVIVTGANCDIGKQVALEMAEREARVILACRDVNKGQVAVEDIRRHTARGELLVRELDLSSFKSIQAFVAVVSESEKTIDVLVNNAGVFQTPYSKTEDGFELQMGVNHLGHVLLTNLLLEKLKQSAPSRVIIVSSGLAKLGTIDIDNLSMTEENYNRKAAYNNSKLANMYFAKELAQQTKSDGIDVFCMHPGMVLTNLGRHMEIPAFLKLFYPLFWLLVFGPAQGAQSIIHCATAPELQGKSGQFFGKRANELPWPKEAENEAIQRKLWDISITLTGL